MKYKILWDQVIKSKTQKSAYTADSLTYIKNKQNDKDATLSKRAVYKCYIDAPTTSKFIIFIYFARSTYSNVSVFTTIFSPCSINVGT